VWAVNKVRYIVDDLWGTSGYGHENDLSDFSSTSLKAGQQGSYESNLSKIWQAESSFESSLMEEKYK
jgi:hypothetical protein